MNARGSGPDYCSAYPGQPHHMVSHSAGKAVRWVEICSLCNWIDSDALDGWAENYLKEQLSARAQRIAVATETEPFAFVQRSDEVLTLEEVLLQALAAASARGAELGATGNASDGKRETAIYKALVREVARFQRLSLEDAATRAVEAFKNAVLDGHFSDESIIKIRRAVEGGQS